MVPFNKRGWMWQLLGLKASASLPAALNLSMPHPSSPPHPPPPPSPHPRLPTLRLSKHAHAAAPPKCDGPLPIRSACESAWHVPPLPFKLALLSIAFNSSLKGLGGRCVRCAQGCAEGQLRSGAQLRGLPCILWRALGYAYDGAVPPPTPPAAPSPEQPMQPQAPGC